MVYFVQADGIRLIKVGCCNACLRERINLLITMSPVMLRLVGVMPGTKRIEAEVLARFDDYRLHGEWFYPTPALIDFIRENAITGVRRLNRYVVTRGVKPHRRKITAEIDEGTVYWRKDQKFFGGQC